MSETRPALSELTEAELELVAGGQAVPGNPPPPIDGTTAIAIGAAASNTAVVEQANVFRVRFG